jgi:hypothetical protein
MDKLIALGFLIVATTLETNGDAVVRMGLNQHATGPRVLLFLGGAGLLFGYGFMLNLAPLEFGAWWDSISQRSLSFGRSLILRRSDPFPPFQSWLVAHLSSWVG